MKEVSQFGVLLLALIVTSCGGGHTEPCNLGELDCTCNAAQCLGDLVCENDMCVTPMNDGSESVMESDSSTDQETDSDSTTSADTDTDTDPSETGMPCEPPEQLCDGVCVDVMNDNSNCGECGIECLAVLDVGECVDGGCAPTYSDCVHSLADPKPSCTEVCQMQGFVGCGECGPSAVTIKWFMSALNCENDSSVVEESGMCQDKPTNSPFVDYRCCCAQQ